ncbi:MAG: hypothetical protein QCI00_03715 [Candidatus Thermoplasmatota archaeon]|nr:hypothetical protein [Candidatus Thermoplasmatota archaeon]
MKKEKYECLACKQTVTVEKENDIPYCCGEPMTKIPKEICLQPSHPEHARPMEHEEPCDDGRGNLK